MKTVMGMYSLGDPVIWDAKPLAQVKSDSAAKLSLKVNVRIHICAYMELFIEIPETATIGSLKMYCVLRWSQAQVLHKTFECLLQLYSTPVYLSLLLSGTTFHDQAIKRYEKFKLDMNLNDLMKK